MTFCSIQSCGPCEREKAQKAADLEVATVQEMFPSLGWDMADEVVAARTEAEQRLWTKLQSLPDSHFKKSKQLPKPGKVEAMTARRKFSSLRMEVKRDDVVGHCGGADDWVGTLSLSDEIARIEAQRAADGIPPLAPTVSVFADDDWSDVTELGVCDDTFETEPQDTQIPPSTEIPTVWETKDETTSMQPSFEPPHRKYQKHQRLRERAQRAVHDTIPSDKKHKMPEATHLGHCCAVLRV